MSNSFLREDRKHERGHFMFSYKWPLLLCFLFCGEGSLVLPEFRKERQVFKSKHEGALETEKSEHSVQTARPTSQGQGQALFSLKLEIIDT